MSQRSVKLVQVAGCTVRVIVAGLPANGASYETVYVQVPVTMPMRIVYYLDPLYDRELLALQVYRGLYLTIPESPTLAFSH